MIPSRTLFRNSLVFILVSSMVLSLALSIPATRHPSKFDRSREMEEGVNRQGKTLNMTMGGLFKEMIQNGMPFRPVPPPFPAWKNLFNMNGTHFTWVPLGSLLFGNNGKIIGG